MRKLTAAGLAVTGLLVTSTVASAQMICAPLLIVTGAIVSATENRELSQKEAMTCGLIRDEDASKAAAAKNKKMAMKKKPAAQ